MRNKIIIIACLILIPILAEYMDYQNQELQEGNKIMVEAPGTGSRQVELEVSAGEILQNYDYVLEVDPAKYSQDQLQSFLDQAVQEIDDTFMDPLDQADAVTHRVYPKKTYVNGLVTADWTFSNYQVLDVDGEIQEEYFENNEDAVLVYVEAELSCENKMQAYGFYIHVYAPELSEQGFFLQKIKSGIDSQQKQAQAEALYLPEEIEGTALNWSEPHPHTGIKIFLLELLFIVLLPFVRMERQKQVEKDKERRLLYQYPEFVSKMTILISCGMPIKQAWNKISAQYSANRQKRQVEVYEEMLITMRELDSGEGEKNAYRNFGLRIKMQPYQRLVRILIQNLEKGTGGLCEQLQRESETAFDERKRLARKLGEEVQTKMVAPLIMMLGIVMAIVIAPAIIEFKM